MRASGPDWTLVYPTSLGNVPGTGTWKAAEAPRITLTSTIDRADVARFMLAQLDSTGWVRRTAVVTG